jgi:hypothetical protein
MEKNQLFFFGREVKYKFKEFCQHIGLPMIHQNLFLHVLDKLDILFFNFKTQTTLFKVDSILIIFKTQTTLFKVDSILIIFKTQTTLF